MGFQSNVKVSQKERKRYENIPQGNQSDRQFHSRLVLGSFQSKGLNVAMLCLLLAVLCIYLPDILDDDDLHKIETNSHLIFLGTDERLGNHLGQYLFWASYAKSRQKHFVHVPKCASVLLDNFDAFRFCFWNLPWYIPATDDATPKKEIDASKFEIKHPHNRMLDWIDFNLSNTLMSDALSHFSNLKLEKNTVVIHERCMENDTLNTHPLYNPTGFRIYEKYIQNTTTDVLFIRPHYGEKCLTIHEKKKAFILDRVRSNISFHYSNGDMMEDFATIFFARVVILPYSTFSRYAGLTSQKRLVVTPAFGNYTQKDADKKVWWTKLKFDGAIAPRIESFNDTVKWLQQNRELRTF